MRKVNIAGTVEAWETGALGEDAAHVRKASEDTKNEVADALGLQAISIRLPKATIDTYKLLAQLHGVGYQPLMREAISRWADAELRQMLVAAANDKTAKTKTASSALTPLRKAA